EAPAQRAQHQMLEPRRRARVASDQQMEAAGELEMPRLGEIGLAADRRAVAQLELDAAVGALFGSRPAVEVADDRLEVRAGEEIDLAAWRIARHTLADGSGQALETAVAILLGQADDLGVDRLVHLAQEITGRRPVDEPEQQDHRAAEQGEIADREAE